MTQLERRDQIIAIALAALAGYVDANGYLFSGGSFVSFMSGNSTKLGIALSTDIARATGIATIIAGFIMGVACATRGRLNTHLSRRALLAAIALVLLGATFGYRQGWAAIATPGLASAMGALNVVLAQDGKVRVGLTYMTGALVRIGEMLGGNMESRASWGWNCALWAALVIGCALGAAAHSAFAPLALVPGALWCFGLAWLDGRVSPQSLPV
ncbi:MAG: DUF1275 domain-containing protein [Alphaproteobacteria bacterium]|nr:DUF1275 domain-containing protein [Alphaproteobacteria bacterium]